MTDSSTPTSIDPETQPTPKNGRGKMIVIILLVALVAFYGWRAFTQQPASQDPATQETIATPTPMTDATDVGLANPAATNCVEQGGTSTILSKADGSQYGVCTFEDNLQCEEWALLRGECPVGGIRVTGYETEAEIYCAITGASVEGEMCVKNGESCAMDAHYDGSCSL